MLKLMRVLEVETARVSGFQCFSIFPGAHFSVSAFLLFPSAYCSFELDGGVFGNIRVGRRTRFGDQVDSEVEQGAKEQSGSQDQQESAEPPPPVATLSRWADLGHGIRHAQVIEPLGENGKEGNSPKAEKQGGSKV
jgi:hypothetical protein